MYAKVIVDIKHEDVNQTYDYVIPKDLKDDLKKGVRVIVPFGAQTRMGFVIDISEDSESATKEIVEVLDDVPVVTEELFKIVEHIMDQSLTIYSKVFETVIPSALSINYDKVIYLKDKHLCPEEFIHRFNTKGMWLLKKNEYSLLSKLRRLQDKKIVEIKNKYQQKTTSKTQFVYQLNENHQYKRIDKYPEILDLDRHKTYTTNNLKTIGLSTSQIQTLTKHDVLQKTEEVVFRDIEHVFDLKDKQVTLNEEQFKVASKIKSSLNSNKTFLLFGITGSGKTEVYLDVIEKVLNNRKKVLILVPEITLIGPMVKRVKSRFNKVAIYHSALSNGEKYDQYQMILNDEVDIVIGTRSGVFMPFNNLGLVIMDEEHDQSFVQSEGVYYDAKEIAELRSKYHHAPLLLGSATPSIVSMHKALNQTYELLNITKRPFNIEQPDITYVDMTKELKAKNTSIFSNILKEKIEDRLSKKEQILMLFNRKGYAPFVLCRQCGHVEKCPDCDISLTYYKAKNTLKCHYCGYEKPFSQTCEICHQHSVKEVGVGIEYVESQIKKTFPNARVLRMDKNVVTTKGSHETIWHNFLNEDADILLGTQMIAKGLDFPKVTLVGVLMADLSLKVPSYRAAEDTYMLLTQIAGRSGRHQKGEVIIQGYKLDHYAIQSVSKGYDSFYKEAIYDRKISKYEPYYHVSQFLIEGESYLKTYQKAFMLKKRLDTLKDVYALGPTPAYIKKIKHQYRFVLTIKYKTLDHTDLKSIFDDIHDDLIHIRYFPNLDIM